MVGRLAQQVSLERVRFGEDCAGGEPVVNDFFFARVVGGVETEHGIHRPVFNRVFREHAVFRVAERAFFAFEIREPDSVVESCLPSTWPETQKNALALVMHDGV